MTLGLLDDFAITLHHRHMIYKIFRTEEWQHLETTGESVGAPIDIQDGYIHFSTGAQVAETAAKHFAGVQGLFLLSVDEKTLGDDLKWEISRGDALFPHLYRSLTTADVVAVHRIGFENGAHVFPDGLAK